MIVFTKNKQINQSVAKNWNSQIAALLLHNTHYHNITIKIHKGLKVRLDDLDFSKFVLSYETMKNV